MSNLERDYEKEISIDGNVATWSCRIEGEINGTYIGTFKFRCFLTPMQKISADREFRELLGANMPLSSDHARWLAFCIVELKHRIVSSPPFWFPESGVGGDLPDENVLSQVLNAATAAEIKFRANLSKTKSDMIERAKKAAEEILNSQKIEDGFKPENEQ